MTGLLDFELTDVFDSVTSSIVRMFQIDAIKATHDGTGRFAYVDGASVYINPPISAKNLTFGFQTNTVNAFTADHTLIGANKLDIITVTGSTAQVPTVSGAGGTWVLIGSQFDGGGIRGVHMFRDLSPVPHSGQLTIDFGGINQNFIGWSVDEFSNVDLSGTHGSGAVVQFAGTNGSGTNTGITATLAALGAPTNAAYGFVRNNAAAAIVEGTGFVGLSNQFTGELSAEWAINKTAVAWTWASQAVTSVALAIEIKSAPP